MRVLVIGAGGFLGAALVKVIGERHRVRAFDLELVPAAEAVAGDLGDFAAVDSAVAGCDAVVFAAMAPYQAYEEGATAGFTATVTGFYHVMEAARRQEVKQVVHLSSGAIYGPRPGDTWFDDQTPRWPASPYGLTKELQETIARYFVEQHRLHVTLVRPWSIIDRELGQAKLGQPASSGWGLIDRHDLARAVLLAIEQPAEGLRAYEIAAGPGAEEHLPLEPLTSELGWRPGGSAEPGG